MFIKLSWWLLYICVLIIVLLNMILRVCVCFFREWALVGGGTLSNSQRTWKDCDFWQTNWSALCEEKVFASLQGSHHETPSHCMCMHEANVSLLTRVFVSTAEHKTAPSHADFLQKNYIIESTLFHFYDLLALRQSCCCLVNGIQSRLQRDASWLRLPCVLLGPWDYMSLCWVDFCVNCVISPKPSCHPNFTQKCILPSLIHAEEWNKNPQRKLNKKHHSSTRLQRYNILAAYPSDA